jgi:hypothetical protein
MEAVSVDLTPDSDIHIFGFGRIFEENFFLEEKIPLSVKVHPQQRANGPNFVNQSIGNSKYYLIEASRRGENSKRTRGEVPPQRTNGPKLNRFQFLGDKNN